MAAIISREVCFQRLALAAMRASGRELSDAAKLHHPILEPSLRPCILPALGPQAQVRAKRSGLQRVARRSVHQTRGLRNSPFLSLSVSEN